MKNTTTAAQAATTPIVHTLTAKDSRSLRRLSWQLETPMDNLLHHIISGGIKHLDNSLAMGCDNMLDFPLDNDFDCTPAMDAMSRDEIAAIVKESGKDAQAVLWARHEEALLARIAARGTKRRNRAAALV